MEHELKTNLLALILIYSKAESALAEATIERRSVGYNGFFSNLRDGKSFTVRKYDDVVRWFACNWPSEVEWPKCVDRPVIRSVNRSVPEPAQ